MKRIIFINRAYSTAKRCILNEIFFDRKQKRAVFTLCAVCLLLAGFFYSCTNSSELGIELGGEVPYQPCPCDEGKSMQAILTVDESHKVLQVETYLFNGYPSDEVLKKAFPYKKPLMLPLSYPIYSFTYFIIYDSKNDLYWFYKSGVMSYATGRVCNFPDFAKEWDIPEEGLKIFFTGSLYNSCQTKSYYGLFGFYGDERDEIDINFSYNLVLTHLKRR